VLVLYNADWTEDLPGTEPGQDSREVAEYYVGWMGPEGRAVNVGNFMYWQVALESRRRGCRWFDLGGDRYGRGYAQFKQGMRGAPYELLNEWVAAFNGRLKLSTLATAVHPYPTLGEINKRVAGSVLAPKLFSDRVRKGLKLFFNLKGRACGPEPFEE